MARVLIVDDDEGDRLFHETILERRGHEIHSARDGAEALQVYLRRPIDVVVTDIDMPVPDGMELISSLTALDPDAAIVAVSGATAAELGLAKVIGARTVLTKPVDPERLIEAVEAAAPTAT